MYNKQREQMVEQQVRAWEVLDPAVLDVLQNVPREQFLPEKYKNLANTDVVFNLRPDFDMPSPSVQGKILQALELAENDAVFQIGVGCGYLMACLTLLSGHVTACDANDAALQQAEDTCNSLGHKNISTQHCSWEDAIDLPEKKYDAIVSQYAFKKIPHKLEKSLKINGKAVLFEGIAPIISCVRIERTGENEWLRDSIFETEVSPYPENSTSTFSF